MACAPVAHTLHAPKQQPIGRMKKGYLKFQVVRVEAELAAGVTQQIIAECWVYQPNLRPEARNKKGLPETFQVAFLSFGAT